MRRREVADPGDLDAGELAEAGQVLPGDVSGPDQGGFQGHRLSYPLSPVLRGEGRGEGPSSSRSEEPLTLTLSPEYRGEGTDCSRDCVFSRTRAGIPTAIAPGGTSRSTTLIAPIFAPLPDPHAAEHLRVGPQLHVVLEHRHRPVVVAVADRHALAERAVGADLRVGVDEDVAEVVDPQARARPRRSWGC